MKICEQCFVEKHDMDVGFNGICDSCFEKNKTRNDVKVVSGPYFKEMGVANPLDPKGSTAHVKDIQARRWDSKEKRMYYETPRRTYL